MAQRTRSLSRRRAVLPAACAAVALLLAALPACKRHHAHALRRIGDAAPVVMVQRSADGIVFTNEKEPDDAPTSAMALSLPGGVKGNLDGQTDRDVYAVTVAKAGELSASVSGIKGVDLMLDLLDHGGKKLAHSDRGPAEVMEGIPDFGVEPGKYFLVVSEYVHWKHRRKGHARKGPSPTYSLTAKMFAPPDRSEHEPNEDISHATEVLLGDEVTGFFGWKGDVDVWKVSLQGFSADYALDIDVDGVAGVTPTMEILDGSGNVVLTRTGSKGNGLSLRNLTVAEDQSDYYIRLHGKGSNPQQPYRMHVFSRQLNPDAEVEPNDDPAHATALRTDASTMQGTRHGFLDVGDTDDYRLAVASAALLNVAVKPDPSADVTVAVSAGGNTLGRSDSGQAGAREQLAGLSVPAGATVIISVTGHSSAAAPPAYELSWSLIRGAGSGAAAASGQPPATPPGAQPGPPAAQPPATASGGQPPPSQP